MRITSSKIFFSRPQSSIYVMCCRYYLMALLTIPTLFYLPKFFEYITIPVQKTIKEINPCSEDEGNHTGCTWDENEDAFVTYSYREFNDSELHFSSLRKNYYYRRVSARSNFKCELKFTAWNFAQFCRFTTWV